MPEERGDYIDGRVFHEGCPKAYSAPLSWAVNKKGEFMARVLYTAPHENPAFGDERRGSGRDWATWIFSEEEGLKEGIFASGLELMIDARFEPGACVGFHVHRRTEEIYYILEGEMEMTTVSEQGAHETAMLKAGDAHAVRLGQGHYGKAGPEGARFICVTVGI